MFNPDYATPPGLILEEFIQDNNISREDAASILGISMDSLERLENGGLPVDLNLAEKLEYLTGMSEKTWLTMEATYHNDLKRLKLPPYDN